MRILTDFFSNTSLSVRDRQLRNFGEFATYITPSFIWDFSFLFLFRSEDIFDVMGTQYLLIPETIFINPAPLVCQKNPIFQSGANGVKLS